MQPQPGAVDGAVVADDDQGVGEFVDGDGGRAQPDHDRDLGRVNAQLELLAGEKRRGQRGQAGQGEEDLPGDGGGVEQVPGAAGVSGLDQPPGAVPAQVQPGRLSCQPVRP